MKRILLIMLLSASYVHAQKLPEFGLSKVRIIEPDRTLVVEVKPTDNPSVETNRMYFWYSGNAIHSTQGGFSSRLLNGKYNEYYRNKSLKEQGIFKKGLKEGLWKTWTDNGILTQAVTWKKGIKEGDFFLYDDQGQPQKTGSYHNDLLSGKVAVFVNRDSVQVMKYKAGKPVTIKSNSPGLWQKVKNFSFKHKAPADASFGLPSKPVKPKKVKKTKSIDPLKVN